MTNGSFNPVQTKFPGVFLLQMQVFYDHRGALTKTYQEKTWRTHGLVFEMKEEYFSFSHKGVLRGMHFQCPPMDHAKVVYCLQGQVLDVLLDLRKNSPTFGLSMATNLSAGDGHILIIPPGIAHGFLSKEESTMVYKTSTVHSPVHDAGIRWDSFGFDWGITSPIVSARDAAFPALADFATPFTEIYHVSKLALEP